MVERTDGWSRRDVLGLGMAAGGAAIVGGALRNDRVVAAPLAVEALGAPMAGVRYLGIDGYAFWPEKAQDRLYEDITGSKLAASGRLWAPLPLPDGAIIVELSASYQGQPIMEISQRPLYSSGTALAPAQLFQKTFDPSPGGPYASSESVPAIKIGNDATYTVSAYLTPGTSIIGARVGYLEGFVPYTGTETRVLDTRDASKYAARSEHTIATGLPGRVAVFNIAVTGYDGRGYVAAFPAGTTWPGNSSINFGTAGGPTVANLVLCQMDSSGAITLRVGPSATHVIVDLIGSLV